MSERNEDRFNLDLYSLCTDVLKSLWAILLGAIAVVLIMDLLSTYGTQKSYSTKATFVVTSRGYSSNVYSNLSAAQSMATTFTNILNSDILKKEVCKDVGMDTFDATVYASVIDETKVYNRVLKAVANEKGFQKRRLYAIGQLFLPTRIYYSILRFFIRQRKDKVDF